ncbi:hypothetical protein Tco_0914898 [Tanacetum coccineum]
MVISRVGLLCAGAGVGVAAGAIADILFMVCLRLIGNKEMKIKLTNGKGGVEAKGPQLKAYIKSLKLPSQARYMKVVKGFAIFGFVVAYACVVGIVFVVVANELLKGYRLFFRRLRDGLSDLLACCKRAAVKECPGKQQWVAVDKAWGVFGRINAVIVEGPDTRDHMNTVITVQYVGEVEPVRPRVCRQCHKQCRNPSLEKSEVGWEGSKKLKVLIMATIGEEELCVPGLATDKISGY